MSACPPITIAVTGDPKTLFERIRKHLTAYGIELSGDTGHGAFEGKGIAGEYTVTDNVVTVTVTKKPPLVPCSMVERELRKLFEY
ncbi:MAG: hypothetical protein QF415_03995 [Candidatus Undinarchaeales archaeon]|jgi:hypothetical protein|nr:hypothetical protein [Candidatus Undinarchaeales archaeon]MDP7493734.1 hypothetical protein [Candidatus Undinarchaeales archaeon]